MKILRVSAIWCPSCIIMRPIYDEIVKEFNLETEELDYDFDEEKVASLEVGNTLPVAIIYKDNNEVKRICGEKSINQIRDIIKELI